MVKEGVLTIEDLIGEVQVLCGLSPAKAKQVVFAILWSMEERLKKLEPVTVKGFGRFLPVVRKGRMFGNFKKSTPKFYPDKWVVKFQPHKQVKYLLNPQDFS